MILTKIGEFCGNYRLLWRLCYEIIRNPESCVCRSRLQGTKKKSDFIGKPNRRVICGRGREEGDEESKDVILSFQSLYFICILIPKRLLVSALPWDTT